MNKKIILAGIAGGIVSLLSIVAIYYFVPTLLFSPNLPPDINENNLPIATSCDKSLWSHIYNPDRLKVIAPCITVTGTTEDFRAEYDGDSHIRLRLDSEYSYLINDFNKRDQYGDLVIEVICQNPVYQGDAVEACQNYSNHVFTPATKGFHVKVTGSYVLDQRHGWMEIHPVTSLEVIQ